MSGPGSPSLGHLLIQRGLATDDDIKRCVALQRERARRGDFARLGAILVEQGVVTAAQVEATLREQQIVILMCSVCRAQYNIENFEERGNYECRKCGGLLRRPETLQSLVIQDTMRGAGAPPSAPRPPSGPRPAPPSSGPHSPAPFSRPQGLGLPSPKADGVPPPPTPPARTAGPQDTIRAAPSNVRRRTNVSDSPSGANIIGDYEILGEIARGGMGVIYKARQLGLERVVALKTLNADEARHEDAVERFQREARSIASLRHPNLVTIHTVDHKNGVHFFTMDFVEGIPLDALLKRDGPMAPKKAIALLLPIIDALQYAHSKGVMHRDLKPANIIIDRSGIPFLVDFGIAKRKGERQLTEAGEILGSIPYMAPEYIVGEEFTEACDVYSFGVVMYEAFAGFEKLPFGTDQDGVETIRLLKRIAYEAPAPIREFRPDLDPRIEGIINRAISRDIKVRYSKAAEIAKDLQAWMNDQSSTERPAAQITPPPSSPPPRSSGLWPPLALIAASIAAGASGLFLAERGKAVQRERELLLRLQDQARQLDSSRPEAAAAIRAVVQQQIRDRPELADLAENR